MKGKPLKPAEALGLGLLCIAKVTGKQRVCKARKKSTPGEASATITTRANSGTNPAEMMVQPHLPGYPGQTDPEKRRSRTPAQF